MTKKAIITVGISASGKSSWAEAYCASTGAIELNMDKIRMHVILQKLGRASLPVGESLWKHYNFKKMESTVQRLYGDALSRSIDEGVDIVISNTNLTAKYRNPLITRLAKAGYQVELKDFPITWEEAIKRDQQRLHSVGQEVLYKQWQQWLQYLAEKGEHIWYHPNKAHPSAILVDIDGTLAHMQGRNPFDWKRVGEDSVDVVVKHIVEGFKAKGYTIIVMSGRDSVCRPETTEWLDYHGIPYDALHMRAENDMRKDSIIKKELFDQYVRENYRVYAVVDDRPQVCRMWYDIGIPKVIHVGNPWVEF